METAENDLIKLQKPVGRRAGLRPYGPDGAVSLVTFVDNTAGP